MHNNSHGIEGQRAEISKPFSCRGAERGWDFFRCQQHPRLTDYHGQHTVLFMTAISYTAARENLASTMNRVCNDHTPIIITRNRDQAVVMMSLEDFEALEETAYLLKSPKNAKRIMSAIAQMDAGKGIERAVDA